MVSQILVHLNSQKSRLKKSLFLSAIAVLLVSCGASKPTIKDANEAAKAIERFKKNRYPETNNKSTGKYAGSNSRTVESILNDAEKYLGTPYKFGGNTSSGFVYLSLKKLHQAFFANGKMSLEKTVLKPVLFKNT